MQVTIGLIHPSIMAAYMVYAISMRLITNRGRVDIGGSLGAAALYLRPIGIRTTR
jgi:hypothetical protein